MTNHPSSKYLARLHETALGVASVWCFLAVSYFPIGPRWESIADNDAEQ